MTKHPCPKIVISRCLEFDSCRYDGGIIKNQFINILSKYVDIVTVCPEVDIGMGIPRDPIRIVKSGAHLRLIQPTTGKDFTKEMKAFSTKYLNSLNDIDGFILKSRSPSCGVKDAKHYNTENKIIGRTNGFFANEVLKKSNNKYNVITNERLSDISTKNHFLIKLFTLAGIQRVSTKNNMTALLNFHQHHQAMFELCNKSALKQMNLILNSGFSYSKILQAYKKQIFRIFARKTNLTSNTLLIFVPTELLKH